MATLHGRIREWILRLWGSVRPGRSRRDLEDEMRLHLALAEEDARRRGASADEARRIVVRELGHVTTAANATHDQQRFRWLDDLMRDVRHGLRMLARSPAFAIVATLSMAIGVGVNSAVFSFADALLLRPLTVPRPSEVLTVGSRAALQPALVASYPEYVDIRDRNRSFASLAAFTTVTSAVALSRDALPSARLGLLVNGSFFATMQIAPLIGRTFREDEDEVPGRDAVVVLGYDFWAQQFGADRAVLGRRLRINGIEHTVIGVTPPGFTGPDQYSRYEFYAPLMMWLRLGPDTVSSPLDARDRRALTIKGRLRPDATLAHAQAELSVVAENLERAFPATNRQRDFVVRTELQARIDQNRPVVVLLATLSLLAALVLFVACANVAGLLTSRAPARARELALRMAIGAGRTRMIRQLVTESLLISTIGCLLGLAVGYGGVGILRQFQVPTDLPIAPSFRLDLRVLLFSSIMAIVTGVVFGIVPAVQATRTDLMTVVRAVDAAGVGRGRRWGRAVLVSGQVAVTVVVLITAASLYRSVLAMLDAGPGYRTERLLQISFNPSLARYSDAQARQFFDELTTRARRVPGVTAAALASSAPTDVSPSAGVSLVPEGFQLPDGQDRVSTLGASVDEHYFDLVGMPIVRGRAFLASDTDEAPRVAIVNEQAARLYWPGQDVIGKRFHLNDANGPWVQIVGVTKTGKYIFMSESPRAFVYLPYRQQPQPRMTLLVASQGDPAALAAPLRAAVRELDPSQPAYNVRTLDESYRLRMVSILDVVTELVAAMAVMGLGLALVGLYGLVAYSASRRTREIGIRMAIGASRGSVLRMIVRQGLVLAVIGLSVGVVAGVGVRQAQAAMVAGTVEGGAAVDGVAIAAVIVVVLAVTSIAAYLPARRAAHLNPTDALRTD